MAAVSMSTNFPPVLAREMFSLVKGHSSLAKMAAAEPIPFAGKDIFTFSADHKIAVVAENAEKPVGDLTLAVKKITPIKVVYGARFSDEFKYAAEEAQLDYLRKFADGFAKMLAEGFDEMALYGVNPYSGQAATQTIGNNNLNYIVTNYNQGSNVVAYDSAAPDASIDTAIGLIDSPTGVLMGKSIRSAIAGMTAGGARKYPEFAWGATPAELGGMRIDTNSTVELDTDVKAFVGDFNSFKWGFAKELPLEIIEFGDPDGAGDLKRLNQIYLRSEAYIGWTFLNDADFSMVFDNGNGEG